MSVSEWRVRTDKQVGVGERTSRLCFDGREVRVVEKDLTTIEDGMLDK